MVDEKEISHDEEILENIEEGNQEIKNIEEDLLNIKAEFENKYKRLQADFDNFRKRTQNEKLQLASFIKGEIIKDLLPIIDNFERALSLEVKSENESFLAGFKMIEQNLKSILEKHGLSEIKALGEEFDPNYHQAVMNGPSDEFNDNQISDVLQKGYMIDGIVIRPSMVKVTNNG